MKTCPSRIQYEGHALGRQTDTAFSEYLSLGVLKP